MEEPPPPYSSIISKKAGDNVKIQMIPAKNQKSVAKKKGLTQRHAQEIRKRFGWYAGDGKSCPLSCRTVPARPAALVLVLIYIFAHLALIVRLRATDVKPYMRGVLTMCAVINLITMTAAFVGFWRKILRLMFGSIFYQFGQTVTASLTLVISFSIPLVNLIWCLASGTGDPFQMFTENWAIGFPVCAVFTAFSHFLLAVLVRAALASSSASDFI